MRLKVEFWVPRAVLDLGRGSSSRARQEICAAGESQRSPGPPRAFGPVLVLNFRRGPTFRRRRGTFLCRCVPRLVLAEGALR